MAASFNSSVFNSLDDSGRLLQKTLDSTDEGYAYYSALACHAFHRAIRDRFPNGTRTGPSAVLSSSERFIWTYTELPEEARPPWWGNDLCRMTAVAGQVNALQWARANGCDWDYRTYSAAAGGGHLEVLQWARANGCDWETTTFRLADGATWQWLRDNGCPEP